MNIEGICAADSRLKIVLEDNISPMYTGALLFYAAHPQNLLGSSSEETSLKLKKSLSKTLPIFYPLAGRIIGSFVECNDGAAFIEARVNHLLSEFFKCPIPESLKLVMPLQAYYSKKNKKQNAFMSRAKEDVLANKDNQEDKEKDTKLASLAGANMDHKEPKGDKKGGLNNDMNLVKT